MNLEGHFLLYLFTESKIFSVLCLSVDKIVDDLKALQVEVADIDIRVNDNEKAVTEVKDTVKRQGQDIDIVKKDVAGQGQRLDQVEETVEDTVIKVEEIDGKVCDGLTSVARVTLCR